MGGWLRAAWRQTVTMLSVPPAYAAAGPGRTFDTPPRPIDQVISAMLSAGWGANVGRTDALSVMAVLRGRNEICSLATLPLALYRGLDIVPSALLRQIDPDVPNVVTMAQTIEDLLFDGIAWWRVLGTDFDNYPIAARYVERSRVSLKPPPVTKGHGQTHTPSGNVGQGEAGTHVWLDGEPVPVTQMRRFDSPNPGLLQAGARTVRRALLLDRLASMYAANPRPVDYFTDAEDLHDDGMTDDEISGFLAEWSAARQNSLTAWIPSNVQRADVDAPSPADLQLVELQKQVALEIANGLGIDGEDVGVSTTSRTYFNAQDRARQRINRTLAPYMAAITDRLSMGDTTRRGHVVKFDARKWLEADPAQQIAMWQGLEGMGVMDAAEIRAESGRSGRPPKPKPAPAPAALPAPAENGWRPPIQLGDITPRTFDASAPMTFAVHDFAGVATAPPRVDKAKRTISGLALPYNVIGQKWGTRYRFLPGSLEYDPQNLSRIKHLRDHATPVGVHTGVTDTPEGMHVELSVLPGREGTAVAAERDQLLDDAAAGLYDGLSVGVAFAMDGTDATFNQDDDCWDVARATWRETSTTPLPTFNDARVTKVAASLTGGFMDPCQHCQQRHVPGISCQSFALQMRNAQQQPAQQPQYQYAGQPAQQPAQQYAQPQYAPQPGPTVPVPNPLATFDQQTINALVALLQQQTAGQLPSQQQPAQLEAGEQAGTVNPHHGPAEVREPDPYRFDQSGNLLRGSHDFSGDIFAGWSPKGGSDKAARDRADSWIKRAFSEDDLKKYAITPANVAALNPNKQRPDLYVDQMEYQYPVWAAIDKGPLQDVTPFVVPKYSSSSGLAADHVSGTEPTPGAMAVTTQTITPTAVSGKLEVLREALDQGGNPQMSGLLWRQMVRAYFEALEAYAVAQFVANAGSIADLTITTAATDATLDQSIADALIPLRYVRGGFRFRKAFTQIDLYKALAKAKDTAGAPLYPAYGPMNRAGTADDDFGVVHARGIDWVPAWATAATGIVAASSYMFDPEGVAGWASNPERLDITWRVAWVDIGLFGYKAFALLDAAKAREVIYDPV